MRNQARGISRCIVIVTLSLVVLGVPAARAQSSKDPIRWAITTDLVNASIKAGNNFSARLIATIDEDWHLYSPEQPPGGPLATRIKLAEGEVFKLAGEIDIPQPQVTFDPIFKMETQIFEGETTFTLPVAVDANAKPGPHALAIGVTFQSCNQTTCLPPKLVMVTSDLNVRSADGLTPDKTVGTATKANGGRPTKAAAATDAAGGLAAGTQVPEFTFTDFDGKPRKFSEFRGNYVLIDFWATWCKPCLADIPHLKSVYEQYRDKGFTILGMDSETLSFDEEPDPQFARETQERAKNIVRTRGASWTHATSETAVPVAVKVFGVQSLPAQILIDREGKVVTRIRDDKQLDQVLAELLGAK